MKPNQKILRIERNIFYESKSERLNNNNLMKEIDEIVFEQSTQVINASSLFKYERLLLFSLIQKKGNGIYFQYKFSDPPKNRVLNKY